MLENQQNFHNKKGLGFGKNMKNKRKLKGSYRINTKRHFGFIYFYYWNQRDIILEIVAIRMKPMC